MRPAEAFKLGTLMYTLHMSLSFRAWVLAVALASGLGPQLACFMPDQTVTKSEMDCCERMAGDCSGANMSHACCRTVVQTDVGIVAKVFRNLMPTSDVAERAIDDVSIALQNGGFGELFIYNNHAPPPEPLVSFTILRI